MHRRSKEQRHDGSSETPPQISLATLPPTLIERCELNYFRIVGLTKTNKSTDPQENTTAGASLTEKQRKKAYLEQIVFQKEKKTLSRSAVVPQEP
jgi:hypothetical protein